MSRGKPDGWEQALDDAINSGKSYEEANNALKDMYGEEGTVGGTAYRAHKAKLSGGDDIDEKISDLGNRKRPKEKPVNRPIFTKKKQTEADTSLLAQILNMAIYQGLMPACKNKELKEVDVQEVNPGGAIVANINYFFPASKLDHPLVTLGMRVVILYLKFKSVCGKIKEIKGSVKTVGGGDKGGIKPNLQTEMRS